MAREDPFHIYPIAESAITIEYGKAVNIESHRELLQLQSLLWENDFEGFLDTTITYNSLTVFFDPQQIYLTQGQLSPLAFVHSWIKEQLLMFLLNPGSIRINSTHHLVPVCYEADLAPDLPAVAEFHQLKTASIIELHCSQDWYVFMIGFNPGFAYMGLLPDTLGMPRKSTPVIRVPAGSVGIAGNQTGIYPNSSPGGWQIIGRTPLKIFNPTEEQPAFFKAGDTVRFTPIDYTTFQYLNQHENS